MVDIESGIESNIKVKIPKTLDQRENEIPLNDEESKQIVSGNLDEEFYNLSKIYNNPQILSRLLLHTLPNLENDDNRQTKFENKLKRSIIRQRLAQMK